MTVVCIKGTWKDHYTLTETYKISNIGDIGALNATATASVSTANDGVVCLTSLPLLVGDVGPGQAIQFNLDYYVPDNVSTLHLKTTVCAQDQCGEVYF